MAFNIFIACAGLGMGNASRIAAIIEALEKSHTHQKSGLIFHIHSWGAGHQFLSEFRQLNKCTFQLSEMHNFSSKNSLLKNFFSYWTNSFKLSRSVTKIAPDLIILDSDYHFLSYLFVKCPLVFIGQAGDVVARSENRHYRPATLKEKFNLIVREKGDFWLQKLFCDLVLIPSFNPEPNAISAKTKRVPLIVRQEFLSGPWVEKADQLMGILLSGSQLHKEKFIELRNKFKVKVITPEFNGNLVSHAGDIDSFDSVIVQGGLSSISEALARKKFLVVFPMKDHPEQILNALEVENLSLGFAAHSDELQEFATLKEKIVNRRLKMQSHNVRCDGALVITQIIEDLLHSGKAQSST